MDGMTFDTPFTSTLNQLLSEANDFTTGSPSHGLTDLDLSSLVHIDSDELTGGFHGSGAADLDFASYLESELIMPSSPLLGRKGGVSKHQHQHYGHHHNHQHVSFGTDLSFDTSDGLWSDFHDAMQVDGEK